MNPISSPNICVLVAGWVPIERDPNQTWNRTPEQLQAQKHPAVSPGSSLRSKIKLTGGQQGDQKTYIVEMPKSKALSLSERLSALTDPQPVVVDKEV